MGDQLKHPKEDNYDILNTICVDVELESEDLAGCYYTENIYVAAYLKAKGLSLVAIHRCRDKKNHRSFTHFWFKDAVVIKPFILNYHNEISKDNVNATGMVSALQAIKKILNIGRLGQT